MASKTPFPLLSLQSCLPLLFITTAQAQPQEDFPTTIVTANRIEEPLAESAATVEVITRQEIFEKGLRTIPESFRHTPGVMVQKTTHGHGSPFIRGFTGRQNLFLIDGIRLNNSTIRSGPVQYLNTIDSFAVDRLELVKSQGSVQYGSDALGGTLNILTRGTGFEEEGPGFFQGGAVQYRFDTNSESHVGRLETRLGQGDKWGLMLGITAKDFGDIRDSELGTMTNTGYPEQNVDFKFESLLNSGTTVTLAHQYLNQDEVWRWHSTLFNDTPWNGTRPGRFPERIYDQERSLSYLRFEGEPAGSFIDRWATTFSYQKIQDSEFQNRGPSNIRNQIIDLQTYGLDVQLESAIGEGNLVYGFDYYQDEIDSLGFSNGAFDPNRRPLADDSTYRLAGAFAQYQHPLSEKFEATIGARYTYAEADLGKVWNGTEDESGNESWDAIVFNLRGAYQLAEGWTFYGGASQAFRAPNTNDLSGNVTSLGGFESVGSQDLDPEESWTFELGGRYEAENADLNLSVFRTEVDDLITRVPQTAGSTTLITTNASEAWIQGVELEGAWQFCPNWTLSGYLTWQEGRTKRESFIDGPTESDFVSRLSPLVGSLALRYDSPSERWWIEGRITAAERQNKLADNDLGDPERIPPGGTPGYVTASLYGGLQATENLALTLGLENLTDEDYRIHGSGVNEQGINAVFGARLTW